MLICDEELAVGGGSLVASSGANMCSVEVEGDGDVTSGVRSTGVHVVGKKGLTNQEYVLKRVFSEPIKFYARRLISGLYKGVNRYKGGIGMV